MRRILALLLAAAMSLSLFVVAGATEDTTPPGEVKLLVSGTLDETTMIATYTISMDASGSAGVAALQFCLTPDQNMTQQGDAQLENVAHIFQVQDRGDDPSVKGTFDYTLNNGVGKYLAYGGKVAETGGHYISGEQDLMTIKYKLTGNSGTLTVSEFIACKNGSDKMEERYTCTAPATVTVSTGVTVSGTAVSWINTDNTEDNAVYLLYPATVEDATIKAQWKDGSSYSATYTGTKGAISKTTVNSREMNSQPFTFTGVAPGEYNLVIFKPGKYVPKIVPITVSTTAYDCGQLKLWLYGDVNYDGEVSSPDLTQLYRYFAKKTSVFTKGSAQDQSDCFKAADITGIRDTDNEVDSRDLTQMLRYLAKKSSLFSAIN